MPLVRRTRATLRSAELGFFGVTVRTTVQTPLLKGLLFRAGDLDLTFGVARPFLTSWLTVGIFRFLFFSGGPPVNRGADRPSALLRGIKKAPSLDRGPMILNSVLLLKSSEP